MRYLAIDYGARRVGLAICDRQQTMASPYAVLPSGRSLYQQIAKIVREQQIDAVVVGLPLNMDGSEGPQAARVRAFVGRLAREVGVPIHLQDERLTSFAAQTRLDQWPISRTKRLRRVDAVAAVEILEAFLEGMRT